MNDILNDSDGELIFKDGDFSTGWSDGQHQEDILLMQKGELKEKPTATAGIVNYLRDQDIDGMLHEIRARFTEDGMSVARLSYNEQTGDLEYEANYPQ